MSEIGKIDGLGGIGGGASPLNQINQQATLGRAGELGTGAPAAPPKIPQHGSSKADQVNLSDNDDDARGAAVSNNLLAAWGAGPAQGLNDTAHTQQVNAAGGAQAIGNFSCSQTPPPGMAGGGVFGPNGTTGVTPGMQAGGVFTTPRIQAA